MATLASGISTRGGVSKRRCDPTMRSPIESLRDRELAMEVWMTEQVTLSHERFAEPDSTETTDGPEVESDA